MATLARKKSCLSETLALLKELVIASHPHKRELLASLCQAPCVWVMGNKASSRPGHLLEEQRWRWEGNPPASEPRVLIDACFHCRKGTNAALLHAELLLSASLCPGEEPGVFIWALLRRRRNSLHTCQGRES